MFHIKDRKTGQLFDQRRYLGPKRRKLLDESWAVPGKNPPQIACGAGDPFFSLRLGRPTKELYAMLAAILFQQIFDLTDEETVIQMAFNLQWHYALDIPEESDGAKYICLKTLWNLRNRKRGRGILGFLLIAVTITPLLPSVKPPAKVSDPTLFMTITS